MGEGEGKRLEVVDQEKFVRPSRRQEAVAGERPCGVGQANDIGRDGPGDGKGRYSRAVGYRVEIGFDRYFERREPIDAVYRKMRDRELVDIGDAEARVGAADIGDE